MAARSRPRGPPQKDDDAHEERNMWNQFVTDMKKLKTVNARATEVSRLIVEAEDGLGADGTPTVREIDTLQDLYREGLKLAEEEQKILNEDHNGAIQNIGLLTALRNATESEPPRVAAAPLKARNTKRKLDSDGTADSPGPSPVILPSASGRVKSIGSRSGSVPSVTREGKEASVKIDDTLNDRHVDGAKGTLAEKAGLLTKNAEVAYKQSKQKGVEGEWIQCIILNVIAPKLANDIDYSYEVQDPEPDENGHPGQIYKTSASTLVPIPAAGSALADYPKGKQVLARYPDTTTFYRAEVMGMKRDSCRLKFEGEEEIGKEMDVDRRYVLDYSGR
ncbi:MAG: hypothetical protein M1825_005123 [Sarcosagium campestre]|nr:MAG: hypothetical protein M1825_005123 [Sarcosagium campestre]